MGNLYNNIMQLCESRGIKGAKMCTDTGISKGLLTDLKMGRRTGVSAVTAQKIASYFGVSVGYLLGEEEKSAATPEGATAQNNDISLDDFTYAMHKASHKLSEEDKNLLMSMAAQLAKAHSDRKP